MFNEHWHILIVAFTFLCSCSTNRIATRVVANVDQNSCSSGLYKFIDLSSGQKKVIRKPKHIFDIDVPYKKIKSDTSIELELAMQDGIVKLITTDDGTLDSLFKHLDNSVLITDKFAHDLTNGAVNDSIALRKFKWDDLTLDKRKEVLTFISKYRKYDFFENREVLGTIVREELTLDFPKEITLFGTTYSKGNHTIPIGKYFRKVEYVGPEDARDASAVELHLRTNQNAGSLLIDGWKLMKLMDVEPAPVHVHLVDFVPFKTINKMAQEGRKLEAITSFVANVRHSNLLAEFKAVLDGRVIETIVSPDGQADYFGHMTTKDLRSIWYFINEMDADGYMRAQTRYKMFLVGFRGSDSYQNRPYGAKALTASDEALYGQEVRSFDPADKNFELMSQILDNTQEKMATNSFLDSIEVGKLREWLLTINPKFFKLNRLEQADLISKHLWYDKPFEDLIGPLEKYIKDPVIFKFINQKDVQNDFESFYQISHAFKMILYAWEDDYITHNNPKLIQQITEIRLKFLKSMMASYRPETGVFIADAEIAYVIRDFLVESGLGRHVFDQENIPINSTTFKDLSDI